MATKISDLTEDVSPATNSLVAVVVNNITRKTALQNILNLVTGGTVTDITGGTNITRSSVGSPTKNLTIDFSLPGLVVPYAASQTTTPPTGWLFCNGQSLSTTTFSGLYAVIGYTYGGSGANFNVPDLRGRIPFGEADNVGSSSPLSGATFASGNFYTLGSSGGFENHLLTAAQTPLKNHTHTASGAMTIYGGCVDSPCWDEEGCAPPECYSGHNHLGEIAGPTGSRGSSTSTSSGSNINNVAAALSHNNMPPAIVLSYLIKT